MSQAFDFVGVDAASAGDAAAAIPVMVGSFAPDADFRDVWRGWPAALTRTWGNRVPVGKSSVEPRPLRFLRQQQSILPCCLGELGHRETPYC